VSVHVGQSDHRGQLNVSVNVQQPSGPKHRCMPDIGHERSRKPSAQFWTLCAGAQAISGVCPGVSAWCVCNGGRQWSVSQPHWGPTVVAVGRRSGNKKINAWNLRNPRVVVVVIVTVRGTCSNIMVVEDDDNDLGYFRWLLDYLLLLLARGFSMCTVMWLLDDVADRAWSPAWQSWPRTVGCGLPQ